MGLFVNILALVYGYGKLAARVNFNDVRINTFEHDVDARLDRIQGDIREIRTFLFQEGGAAKSRNS